MVVAINLGGASGEFLDDLLLSGKLSEGEDDRISRVAQTRNDAEQAAQSENENKVRKANSGLCVVRHDNDNCSVAAYLPQSSTTCKEMDDVENGRGERKAERS